MLIKLTVLLSALGVWPGMLYLRYGIIRRPFLNLIGDEN
jgi:hypothetical protein